MSIRFLEERFIEYGDAEAVVWRERGYTYNWLQEQLGKWKQRLDQQAIPPGSIVILEGDFSPGAMALLLAIFDRGCILVPITSAVAAKRDEFVETAQGEFLIRIDDQDEVTIERLTATAKHPLYTTLRMRRHPGLVLFSSGSTGKSKASVHDIVPMLEKYKARRHRLRSISFLLFDHIGGVNTMLYALSNGGCLITVSDRSPDSVLRAIQDHRVDLLPTTPTFLNLILISEAYRKYDLTSLQTITYGTEPMLETTLKRFHALLPSVRLLQTYGLSEIGIMRSKSRGSDSLWVKIGGEGFQTRVVDGILQVKAESAMLGYLNASSPFTDDGWFNTQDRVEVDGEYLRILGRQSEIINVGGEKVYPAEVESVIQAVDNVAEARVYGESNTITGQIVCAQVSMIEEENRKAFVKKVKRACRERMEPFKVPVRVEVVNDKQYSERYKKLRANV